MNKTGVSVLLVGILTVSSCQNPAGKYKACTGELDAAPSGDVILVCGTIDKADNLEIDTPLTILESGRRTVLPIGQYCMQSMSVDGDILDEVHFDISFGMHVDPGGYQETDFGSFCMAANYVEGTERLVFSRTDMFLGAIGKEHFESRDESLARMGYRKLIDVRAKNCDSDEITFTIENTGLDEISFDEIDIFIEGEAVDCVWKGNLRAKEEAICVIERTAPVDTLIDASRVSPHFEIKGPSGSHSSAVSCN